MWEQTPLLIIVFAFLSVAGTVVFVGQRIADTAAVDRRLSSPPGPQTEATQDSVGAQVLSFVSRVVDEKKFGIDGPIKTKLRRDLMRAGYFSDNAVRVYIAARLGLVVVLPILAYVLITLFSSGASTYLQIGAVAGAAFIGLFGVDAYVSRKQGTLQNQNRTLFPDLIDMLVVCVDAGLSLDAALARIAPEIGRRSRCLEINLVLLGAETRAGRSMSDALGSLAERLNLDEVRSFAILLRQSFELGTDIADALRVFSDEMRAKRLLRAEEMANKLPVKMTLPLGACIFPVILMVIMVPVMIRLMSVFASVHH